MKTALDRGYDVGTSQHLGARRLGCAPVERRRRARAIDLHRRQTISFWGAVIVRSNSELGRGTALVGGSQPGQSYGGVRVADPFI